MHKILTLSLNQDLPFPRYINCINPDPEYHAMRASVFWLQERSITILTVSYNAPDSEPDDPSKKHGIN